ncbi:hypothetical protein [Methanogenium sp. MK-MG]|uniref:hypothetical protein n=1 Tax=Methanogenium sp. MK-MG TaxID=2599926 RepID=UPI0013ED500F|nr:hypothetical protein [Methanogenium sp. MK-MG]
MASYGECQIFLEVWFLTIIPQHATTTKSANESISAKTARGPSLTGMKAAPGHINSNTVYHPDIHTNRTKKNMA